MICHDQDAYSTHLTPLNLKSWNHHITNMLHPQRAVTTGELVGTAELPSAVEHFLLRAPAKAYLALAVARQVADHLETEAVRRGMP